MRGPRVLALSCLLILPRFRQAKERCHDGVLLLASVAVVVVSTAGKFISKRSYLFHQNIEAG
jgi:hypothetical protein